MHVSIITISKDDAAGLAHTVASVMAQSYTSFELLLVRSGTSQNTELPDDARIVVIDVPARGISAAFNVGVVRSRGEWLQFLNGGDIFSSPESLLTLMAARRAAVPMVLSFAQVHGRQFTIPRHALRSGTDSFLYASHQASLFRRSLFAEFGLFAENVFVRMDLEWLARLPKSTAFTFVNCTTVHFDATGVSASDVVTSSVEEVKILWHHPASKLHAVEVALMRLPFRIVRREWRRLRGGA